MGERKSSSALTTKESDAFKKAVTDLIADGKYGEMVKIHADMSHNMHTMSGTPGATRFLAWHRAYLLHMEEQLANKVKGVTIPYWDWVGGGVPTWLHSFKPEVNGVKNERDNFTNAVTDAERIKTLLAIDDYDAFTYALERDPHNKGHRLCKVPMIKVPIAPCDPIFWMHHSAVDKVWADWQAVAKHKGKGPLLTGTDATMDPWTDTVSSLSSISKLGYSYA